MKYFRYRYEDLLFRGAEKSEDYIDKLIADLSFVGLEASESLPEFFRLYNEDTLAVSISTAYRKLNELIISSQGEIKEHFSTKKNELMETLDKLNELLFECDNQKSSYLKQTQKQYIDASLKTGNFSPEFASLKILAASKIPATSKKQEQVRMELLKREVEKIVSMPSFEDYFREFVGEENADLYELVTHNSSVLYRYVLYCHIYVKLKSAMILCCKKRGRDC